MTPRLIAFAMTFAVGAGAGILVMAHVVIRALDMVLGFK